MISCKERMKLFYNWNRNEYYYGFCDKIPTNLQKECRSRQITWNARAEIDPEKATIWTDQKNIRWCHHPNIFENSLNAFYVAIKEYETALPGCIGFKEVKWVQDG